MIIELENLRGSYWNVNTLQHLSSLILRCAERGIGLLIEISKGRIVRIHTLNCPTYDPMDLSEYDTIITKIRSNLIATVYMENTLITSESTGNKILLNFVIEKDVLI